MKTKTKTKKYEKLVADSKEIEDVCDFCGCELKEDEHTLCSDCIAEDEMCD